MWVDYRFVFKTNIRTGRKVRRNLTVIVLLWLLCKGESFGDKGIIKILLFMDGAKVRGIQATPICIV